MLIYLIGAIAGLTLFVLWVLIAYCALRGCWPGEESRRNPERSFATRALAWQAVALALAMLALLTQSLPFSTALAVVFVFPIAGPVLGLWAYSSYTGFLSLPLLVAVGIGTASAFVAHHFLQGRLRVFVPTVGVIALTSAFFLACHLSFERDVMAASVKLQPDCLDRRPFPRILLKGYGRWTPKLRVRAQKGPDVYGWSFRTRDFYKLGDNVQNNFPRPYDSEPLPPFRSCRQAPG
jgi:hypothetical protein